MDPGVGVHGWLLALVLFLWTPPHFWSLAIAGQADYAAAGVPMLPVVVGAERAARIVYASVVALVLGALLRVRLFVVSRLPEKPPHDGIRQQPPAQREHDRAADRRRPVDQPVPDETRDRRLSGSVEFCGRQPVGEARAQQHAFDPTGGGIQSLPPRRG